MIKTYSFKPYEDNSIVEYLQDYIKSNPCCSQYPNCSHPPIQSDPNVFKVNNKTVKYIKKHYFKFLKDLYGPHKIKESKAWILKTDKNKNVIGMWHKHFQEKDKDSIQVSGICYLTPTKIGTEFNLEHFKIYIKPINYTWYLWDSKYLHRPMEGIQNTDRVILATQTVLNEC